MAVKYYLTKIRFNKLKQQTVARVSVKRTLNEEDMAEDMARRAGLKKEIALAYIRLLTTCVCDALVDGNSVNMGLAKFSTKVLGDFNGYEDSFDERRNSVQGDVRQGTELAKRMKTVKVTKTVKKPRNPTPISYIDINTNAVNRKLTPGGMGMILGVELKFDEDNKELGVFLKSEDGKVTRVEVYGTITKGRTMFIVPATLKPGIYKLEFRNNYSKINPEIRYGFLFEDLLVEL